MSPTLRVLGCATPYPRPGQPCSGFLVDSGSGRVLVELGLGVWPELLRYTQPDDLDAIWVSHLHPDHSGDLLAAYQWAANTPGAKRLTVYGPPGWANRIGAALPVEDGPAAMRRAFDVREHAASPTPVAGFVVTAASVRHSVPAYGLRLTHPAGVLGYSGDSAPCPVLSVLAAGADVFLCEAGTSTPGHPGHCTPEDAALVGADASRVVLTHLATNLVPADAVRRAGGATVAAPGLVLTIGP